VTTTLIPYVASQLHIFRSEVVTPTVIPVPDVNAGSAATINTITSGIETFFSSAWPALVGLLLLMLLAMVAMRFGFGGITKFIRLGGRRG
jgi:hypothetical protein